MGASDGFPCSVKTLDPCLHFNADAYPSHVVASRRPDFNGRLRQVDSIRHEPVDYRSKPRPKLLLRNVPKIQINTAMRRPSARFHLFDNSVGGLVAYHTVLAVMSTAVAVSS